MTEDGTLIANPPPGLTGIETNIRFHVWAARLGLTPTVRRSCMAVRLRAQGRVDGILVTIWGTYPIAERYGRRLIVMFVLARF